MQINTTQRPTGIITKDDKVLLIYRIKNHKEYYTFPGGHIESGENLEKTFVREIKEELNFKVLKYKKIFDIYDNTILNNEKREHIFFLVEKFSGKLKLGEPELSRMKKGNNNYYPTWYNKKEFKKLSPVYPRGIKKFILENIFKQ